MTDYREGTHREKKSRKVHSCDECKQKISKGEVYIRLSIFQNGRYTSVARHKECVEVAAVLRDRLMTPEGYPLTMSAGLKAKPRLWINIRAKLGAKYPTTYSRLILSGLPF